MPTFDHIKRNVNKKTKVIVIIHMQGLPVDYLGDLQNPSNPIFIKADSDEIATKIEKAVHRLVTIGVIDDYTKQYSLPKVDFKIIVKKALFY